MNPLMLSILIRIDISVGVKLVYLNVLRINPPTIHYVLLSCHFKSLHWPVVCEMCYLRNTKFQV
jgi:hypothetical protein